MMVSLLLITQSHIVFIMGHLFHFVTSMLFFGEIGWCIEISLLSVGLSSFLANGERCIMNEAGECRERKCSFELKANECSPGKLDSI